MSNFKMDGAFLAYTGEEPKTLDQAWDMTIEKWETIFELLQDKAVIFDGGIRTCGLCQFTHCFSCPVREYTGQAGCADTPYGLYYDYTIRDHLWKSEESKDGGNRFIARIAEAELAFLIRVRDLSQNNE